MAGCDVDTAFLTATHDKCLKCTAVYIVNVLAYEDTRVEQPIE